MRRTTTLRSALWPARVFLIGTIWLNSGCQPITLPAAADPNPATSVPTQLPIVTEEPTMPATPIDANTPMDENKTAVEQATADLAARLSVDEKQIEVVEVQDVTWPDAGLGCPQPGMMYAQVVTPGMRIILAVDGQEYTYHAGRNQASFLCEKPQSGTLMLGNPSA